ncbi:MAG: ankyrin repeat domain-containing protein [Candidatus Rhabdochlamydia sp.]
MTQISSIKQQQATASFSGEFDTIQTILCDKRLGEAIRQQKAINQLILCMGMIENISDRPQLYEYIFLLFPLMTGKSVGQFFDCLQKLSQYTAHLPEQQQQLAFHLADYFKKSAFEHNVALKDTFPIYLQAMDYLGKAIQISASRHAHEKASCLLLEGIKILTTSSRIGIKDRLDRAKSLGDINKFKEAIEDLHSIESFCWGETGQSLMQNLYDEATEIMNQILPASEHPLHPHRMAIKKGCDRAYKNDLLEKQMDVYPTEKYLKALTIFRATFSQITDETSISGEKTTQALRTLVKVFLKDAFLVLGAPPCHYDIRAMGSAGREELCCFSDLEVMILIKNKEYINYFERLLQFLDLQIRSLGETASIHFMLAFSCIHTKNPSGFNLEINPTCIQEYIQTPESLAELQKKVEEDPATLSHMALFSISLDQNTPILFDNYRQLIKAAFLETRDQNVMFGKAQALRFIQARVGDYRHLSHLEDVTDLKKNYAHPLNLLLGDIALYWNIAETNTDKIIQAFEANKIFSEESCALLREFCQGVYWIRLKLHAHYQEQKEEGYLTGEMSQHKYVLSAQEKTILERGKAVILKPLYSLLTSVFQSVSLEEQNDRFASTFSKVDLAQVALQDLLFQDNPSRSELKKFCDHIHDNKKIHVALQAILDEKPSCALKLYEELGLSLEQAAGLISFARNRSHSVQFICPQKKIDISQGNIQKKLLEAQSAYSLFYGLAHLLLTDQLSVTPLKEICDSAPDYRDVYLTLNTIIKEKRLYFLNIYEELNLSVSQAVDVIGYARKSLLPVFLIFHRKKIEITQDNLQTALLEAISINSLFYTELLLALGARIHPEMSGGKGPLHQAIQEEASQVIPFLISQVTDINQPLSAQGRTALHLFAKKGNIGYMKLLLKKGAFINQPDHSSQTPLHLAIISGNDLAINFLIKEGASAEEGLTNQPMVSLYLAAIRGDQNKVEQLLLSGVSPEFSNGATLLHVAAFYGHKAIIKDLIASGKLSLNAKNQEQRTALHLALMEGPHVSVVSFLLKEKALAYDPDHQGYTPLHYAAEKGCLQSVELLLGQQSQSRVNGAFKVRENPSINALNHFQKTPLYLSTVHGHREVIERLLKAGATPLFPGSEHENILHVAAFYGHSELLMTLLANPQMQSMINDQDYNGNTPLDLAKQQGNTESIKLITFSAKI